MAKINRALKFLVTLITYLFKGEIFYFLHEIARFLPNWSFKFNAGTIMISDSPSIRTRHYDRFLARKVEPGDIPEIADFIGSSESTLI